MKCVDAQRLINELSAAELRDPQSDVRQHAAACPACSRAFALRTIASQSLAASVGSPRAGAEFKDRILGALDRAAEDPQPNPPGARRPRRFSWGTLLRPSPVWAVVAVVLVLYSSYTYMRTVGYFAPRGEMPADMARFVSDVGHDAYLYSRLHQTFELRTQSPEEVRNWYASRLDFPVRVPATLSPGCEVEGIRLWHTVSRLSALVSYRSSNGRRVTLFMISATNLANHGGRTLRRGGRAFTVGESFENHVVAWQDEGIAYALVSDAPSDELLAMAENFVR